MSMEQEEQGFEQGFAAVMNLEPEQHAPAADAADAADAGGEGEQGAAQDNAQGSDAADTTEAAATEQVAAAETGEQGATPAAGEQGGAEDGSSQADADPDPNDEIVLDGLTRRELRNLLSRASEVDGLKDGLRKAHGKIGEMNDRLRKAPAQGASGFGGVSLAGLEGEAFDKAVSDVMAQAKIDANLFGDYSEQDMLRGIVTAMLKLQQLPGGLPQGMQVPAQPVGEGAAFPVDMPHTTAAAVEQTAAEQMHDDAAEAAAAQQQNEPSTTSIQVEQLVLDRVRPGWRDTVAGQEFNLWLGAQDQSYQQHYLQANTAEQFAGVLDQFGQWKTARDAAVSKRAQGQQRLTRALTPTGSAPKPHAAMTEDEEFEAAFKSVAQQRL